ncbi:FKBP-type peptidyl-prolyl cis-trans isomerase [Sphingomonas sp. GlSt437]|uniref:FKBP-type peptidyl-prolyl cis-trans isomerase n=1 Tax=Sphingomonas sp. GlSt437 TaxID=3389970 RepID=UPI003A884A72
MATTPPKPAAATSTPRPAWLLLLAGAIGGIVLTLLAQQAGRAYAAYQARPDTYLAHNKSSDPAVKETPSGLQYKVLQPGKGPTPTDGDVTLITYDGKLTNGTSFDKSEQPTPFPVTGVVPGFSEGLKLMQRGGKYRLWIKPSLGYGDKAAGPIPANSVLVFDVSLIDFKSEAEIRAMQAKMAAGGAGLPGAAAPGSAVPGQQPAGQ